jgi:hypothetical protein
MIQELWTPTGVVQLGASPVGMNVETGGQIVAHTFTFKATDKHGRVHQEQVKILADDTTSKAHIEEMLGNAAETFLEQVRTKYDKRPPTHGERKQIGYALGEFRKYAGKRAESTTGKIYF